MTKLIIYHRKKLYRFRRVDTSELVGEIALRRSSPSRHPVPEQGSCPDPS